MLLGYIVIGKTTRLKQQHEQIFDFNKRARRWCWCWHWNIIFKEVYKTYSHAKKTDLCSILYIWPAVRDIALQKAVNESVVAFVRSIHLNKDVNGIGIIYQGIVCARSDCIDCYHQKRLRPCTATVASGSGGGATSKRPFIFFFSLPHIHLPTFIHHR